MTRPATVEGDGRCGRGRARVVCYGLLVFALALWLRLEHLAASEATPYPALLHHLDDARYYARWSEEIASGRLVGQHSFFMGPLYPYTLAAWSACRPGSPILDRGDPSRPQRYDYHSAFVAQSVVGALSCVLVFLIALRFVAPAAALFAGLLAAGYRMFAYFDGLLMPSSQVLFVHLVFLALLLTAARRRGWTWWVAAGAALGLAALAKGIALTMLPAVWLWLAVGFPEERARSRVRRALAVTAGCLAPVLVATAHNRAADGDWVLLTSNGGTNLYMGNGPEATGAHAGVDLEYRSAKLHFYFQGEARPADEPPASEVSRILTRRALAHMRSDPVAALGLLWKKLRLYWNAVEVGTNDHYDFFQRFSAPLRLPTPDFGVVGPLGLAGMFVVLRRWRTWLPLYLLFWTQAFAYTSVFVLGRFRFVGVACLMVFSAAFVEWLVRAVRERRFRALLGAASGVVAAAAWVHQPVEGMSRTRGLGNQLYLMARAERSVGRDPIPAYRQALGHPWREGDASVEQRIDAHLRLATHELEARRPGEARALYERALAVCEEFSPGSPKRARYRALIEDLLR